MKKPPKKPKKSDEFEQLENDLVRLQADFANYKRRSEEERLAVARIAKQQAVIKLLPVLDNLQRATEHQPKELNGNEWAEGITKVAEQLVAQLHDMGVKKIPTVDEEFDPHLHEAVAADGDGDKEIISEELQAGYVLADEVIRPAMVKVKKK